MSLFDLTGKVAIITGSSRGIGRAIAEAMADQGARVVISSRKAEACTEAADMMDKAGNKAAQLEIAMIKVHAPNMALRIIDDAIQAHGGAGVSQDFDLASSWAGIRTLRLADGPDEVHARAIAKMEYARHAV